MCTHTNFYVSQLLYLDICQVCIMLLTGHRFPRNHISLNLFHYAWHNLFSHCQKEGFIYPTMMWNLSVITCNCNRLQNTTHSSWTDLSYLKHHHWQDINRGYFKGTCYAGGKKKNKPNQTKKKPKTSPMYESELLPNLCLFKLILFVLVWKHLMPKTPSEHLNSKKAWLTMVILAIICFFCIKLNFLKMTFH